MAVGIAGQELEDTARHINTKNRASKIAQRESLEFFSALYFMDRWVMGHLLLAPWVTCHCQIFVYLPTMVCRPPEERAAEAVVVEIRDNGFLAYLPRFGLKAPVYLKNQDGAVMLPAALGNASITDASAVELGGSLLRSSSQVEVTSSAGRTFVFKVFDHVRVQVEVVPNRYRRPDFRLLLLGLAKDSPPAVTKGDFVHHVRQTAQAALTVQASSALVTGETHPPPRQRETAYDILLHFQELSLIEDGAGE